MAAGYISLGIVAFILAVKYFAVLPGDTACWENTFKPIQIPILGTVPPARAEGEPT
jgi:hypothetical protein